MRAMQKSHLDRLTGKERQVAMEFVERVRSRFDDQLIAAILFGSRARGKAEPDSDMDVLVVMSSAGPEVQREIRYLAVEV